MPAEDVALVRPDDPQPVVQVHAGDGVVADWTVKVWRDGAVVAEGHGLTTAGDPDPVPIPAPAVGTEVEWLVLLFGAGEDRDYSVTVQVRQGRRGTVQPPVVRLGRLAARDTATEHGRIRVKRWTP